MSSGISTPSASSPAAVTSVTYTIPASASPEVTLVTTPRTFSSRLTGVTSTPAAVEDLVGVVAARNLLGAQHHIQVRVGQVFYSRDSGGVAGRAR